MKEFTLKFIKEHPELTAKTLQFLLDHPKLLEKAIDVALKKMEKEG